jgi:hypothetical protein
MLLLDFFFLLLLLLCVSEKQPRRPCLTLRAADHHTKILGDQANIKNARDAYVACIRAETVSIGALLFELLAAVAPGGWDGRGSDSAGSGRLGPAVTAQPIKMPPRSRRGVGGGGGGAASRGGRRGPAATFQHS